MGSGLPARSSCNSLSYPATRVDTIADSHKGSRAALQPEDSKGRGMLISGAKDSGNTSPMDFSRVEQHNYQRADDSRSSKLNHSMITAASANAKANQPASQYHDQASQLAPPRHYVALPPPGNSGDASALRLQNMSKSQASASRPLMGQPQPAIQSVLPSRYKMSGHHFAGHQQLPASSQTRNGADLKEKRFEMDYEEARDCLLKSSSVEMSTNSQYTSNGTTSFVTSSYPGNSERSHLRIRRENTASSNNLHMEDIEVKLDHMNIQRAPTISGQQKKYSNQPKNMASSGEVNASFISQAKNPFSSSNGSAVNVNQRVYYKY